MQTAIVPGGTSGAPAANGGGCAAADRDLAQRHNELLAGLEPHRRLEPEGAGGLGRSRHRGPPAAPVAASARVLASLPEPLVQVAPGHPLRGRAVAAAVDDELEPGHPLVAVETVSVAEQAAARPAGSAGGRGYSSATRSAGA